MKGVSHLLIGGSLYIVGERFALTSGLYQLPENQGATALALGAGLALALFGAALPDIDSPNAKVRYWLGLGEKQNAWQIASKWVRFVFNPRRRELVGRALAFLLTLCIAPFIALYRVIAMTTIDSTLEHRGPTHTVWLAAALAVALGWGLSHIAAIRETNGHFVIALAFFTGYFSHLLADSCTTSGCAWLWPLWSKPIWILPKLLRFTTGTAPEYVVTGAVVFVAVLVNFTPGLVMQLLARA